LWYRNKEFTNTYAPDMNSCQVVVNLQPAGESLIKNQVGKSVDLVKTIQIAVPLGYFYTSGKCNWFQCGV
jgi:hypothetical protein